MIEKFSNSLLVGSIIDPNFEVTASRKMWKDRPDMKITTLSDSAMVSFQNSLVVAQ